MKDFMKIGKAFLRSVFRFYTALIIAELCAHLYVRHLGLLDPVVPSAVGRFDPLLGWSLKPGSRGISYRTGKPVTYEINSHGLRDREFSYDRSPTIYRIVLIGDSHAFGFGVNMHDHFSKVLERSFDNVEVINMGVSGFGIDQELLLLQSQGIRYNPSLVLVYIPHYGGLRHLQTVMFDKAKPRFVRDQGELRLINSPLAPTHSESNISSAKPLLLSVLSLDLIRMILFQRSPDESGEQAAPSAQQLKEAYELGEQIILKMQMTSKTIHAHFMIATPMEEILSFCRQASLLCLDTEAAMSDPALALPGVLSHMNEGGNAVLAAELARFMKEKELIPKQYR